MTSPRRRFLSVTIPACFACLLWSTAFVGGKEALNYVPPLTLAGLRFMLAGLILMPFCGDPRNLWQTLRTHPGYIARVSLFQTVILYAVFFWGLNLARGAQSAIVIGSSPLIAAWMAHMVMPDDRMTARKAFGITTGMAGIVLISVAAKPWGPGGLAELGGLALLFLAEVSSAWGNILVARAKKPIPPMSLNALQMGLGGVVLFLAAILFEGTPSFSFPVQFYVSLGWLALISAAGFSLWFHLLAHEKVSRLNIWKFLIPVFGAISSWLLIPGESADAVSVLGMILVSFAIIYTQYEPKIGES